MTANGAQAHRTTTALRARLKKNSRSGFGRWAGRIRLFTAVLLALGGGLVLAFAAYGFLRWTTPVDATKGAAEIDVTRVALTVVAGVGGVVALVIAYRRQRDIEQNLFVERFGAAANQLGATDVAVRIAGVYAMAGVADESDGLRRQQCIDVLCGYLRLPYDADHGASGRTKLVVKAPRVERGRVRGEIEEHVEYRQNDREVRATIVRVIADHLQPAAEHIWSTSNFDFRTAYLEDVDFSNAACSGSIRFDKAVFSGAALFEDVSFNGVTSFDDATFSNNAMFTNARFSGEAWFLRATFSGLTFFTDATFGSDVWFTEATFSEYVWFGRTTFSSDAWFPGTTFGSDAWFYEATFSGVTSFYEATFSSMARFYKAAFGNATWFRKATFGGKTAFDEAMFGGEASFENAVFAGQVTFQSTDFGSRQVVFADPRQWGPPPPKFDWDENGNGKPTNIKPVTWPPALATEI
ncbi:pentapeptide repeat-containing protein [Nocardia asiatica]|uniref:pentapeptide repeat-containing protein n=1 Tax=Nocardia asiatica TaxID=209252 RepID=UPI002454B7E6|nr:pentapeptide repeat-containing protein [Nocardia asiatica]